MITIETSAWAMQISVTCKSQHIQEQISDQCLATKCLLPSSAVLQWNIFQESLDKVNPNTSTDSIIVNIYLIPMFCKMGVIPFAQFWHPKVKGFVESTVSCSKPFANFFLVNEMSHLLSFSC